MSEPNPNGQTLGPLAAVLEKVAPAARGAAESVAAFAVGIVGRDAVVTITDGAGRTIEIPIGPESDVMRMWEHAARWPQRIPIEQEIGRTCRYPIVFGNPGVVKIVRLVWKVAPYRTGGARRRRAVVRRVRS